MFVSARAVRKPCSRLVETCTMQHNSKWSSINCSFSCQLLTDCEMEWNCLLVVMLIAGLLVDLGLTEAAPATTARKSGKRTPAPTDTVVTEEPVTLQTLMVRQNFMQPGAVAVVAVLHADCRLENG